ncbi:MAG TPA: SDR family oxidoreductase [Tepidisphaeraceae bacterium]|nr:SDR family oxidoreductase [Tepidisphaeraceae bacterium]
MPREQLTAVITGATSGIGLATAHRFAREGYDLAICARNSDRLEEVQQTIEREHSVKVVTSSCDLSSPAEATQFANFITDRFQQINVLVNNAADAPRATTAEITPEAFDQLLSLNVKAPFLITKKLIPILSGGSIINVSSLAALDPFPGLGIYGACKAWIDLWTKALAAELAGQKIGVFSIRPGAVATPMLKRAAPDFPMDQALHPDEVAELIFSLSIKPWRIASGDAINIQRGTV